MTERQDALAEQLARGLAALKLALAPGQRAALLAYLQLLGKWNRVYNLTAIRDPREMVVRHLLDSLAVVPYIAGPRVLDVGSGAGLPGIPLAVALPDLEFVLLDGAAKKTRFAVQALGELRLANVAVETQRAEDYRPAAPFDTVVSRAFGSLAEFIAAAGALCRPASGRLLAMKGRYPEEELAGVPEGFHIERVARLAVPGLSEERHAVCIGRDFLK